jgi:hypothetical protein
LSDERLRGMHRRLPAWLVESYNVKAVSDASRTWELANGSLAHAFPPNRGDSYTATIALADEYDVLDAKEQNQLLRSVKPTIDNGGKMILLSRANKAEPGSQFKRIYREAKAGAVPWKPLFLPWYVHPGRTPEWYEREKASVLKTTGALDDVREQYPATDLEALAPRSLDKRIPSEWLLRCYREERPVEAEGMPAVPNLEVYSPPAAGRRYVLGADPAEGNPHSDDSAMTVLDRDSGEECACAAGKFDVNLFSGYIDLLGRWYNDAAVMVERNNHGGAVLMWLQEHSELELLCGHDDRPGWLSSQKGKKILYSACADAFLNGEVTVHSFATFNQLGSIEGNTLRAPDGDHDDRADSFALATAAPPPSVYHERGLLSIGRA